MATSERAAARAGLGSRPSARRPARRPQQAAHVICVAWVNTPSDEALVRMREPARGFRGPSALLVRDRRVDGHGPSSTCTRTRSVVAPRSQRSTALVPCASGSDALGETGRSAEPRRQPRIFSPAAISSADRRRISPASRPRCCARFSGNHLECSPLFRHERRLTHPCAPIMLGPDAVYGVRCGSVGPNQRGICALRAVRGSRCFTV